MFDDPEIPGHYETPLVCMNGHVITYSTEEYPENNDKFCKECGEATISACPNCKSSIKGSHRYSNGAADNDPIANYCYNCAQAYPWTERKLSAAKAFVDELDMLTEQEKSNFDADATSLVKNTPDTRLAVLRTQKILTKVGPQVAAMLKDIIVDVASESVKKLLFSS